ncbi:unnamed protein product [Nezara viridula]|uniref:Uncharacterized protein n=1 Tax=Nezara viridula TaxID=85310 RepID=A0A9P0HBX3_NEZVI|nr:unnamed protein product [Nezara viridula]
MGPNSDSGAVLRYTVKHNPKAVHRIQLTAVSVRVKWHISRGHCEILVNGFVVMGAKQALSDDASPILFIMSLSAKRIRNIHTTRDGKEHRERIMYER